ncbi:hypothetical protein N7474_004074 [Penicillium riverlandense]|uniref:uncharacterized protein n=1 Tax=Penicillium riverlandense TaxID=1903569 RepID=UPI0025490ECB|nr:uncharacterized protein N7474_004074 [Penicillium riverlandense]KAJ5818483.1 hypothetical protein N7474_004074 [Penicillium riverlandense]
MAAPPPGSDLSQDRSLQVAAPDWALLGLATFAVGLRFTARIVSKANLWWDDLAVCISLAFAFTNGTLGYIATQKGIGRHMWAPGVDPVAVTKLLWYCEFTYSFVVSSTKICIILFLHRIFPTPSFQRVLYFLSFLVLGWLIAVSFVAGFQCRPYQYFWLQYFDPNAKGECIDLGHFYIANGALSAGTDFLILLSPIPMVMSLQMPVMQKFSVIGIFLLGGFGCVAGAIRVYFLTYMYRSNDITWNQTDCFIWSCVEPATGIISACLPTLRPLLRRFFPTIFSTQGSSKNNGSASHNLSQNGEFYRLHPTPKNAIYRDQDEDELILTEAVGGTHSIPKSSDGIIAVEREIEWSESSRVSPR